ncbi:ATP-binding protein [Paenibacillus zanthoxyli]|uniref:ATP-binding protein n=1 Tax=Paenibacillus zanthoxyli TaxID=369399 RepID=UPI000472DE93|nr:ATP-binding protein [Paenibacillus zanthoxyli]
MADMMYCGIYMGVILSGILLLNILNLFTFKIANRKLKFMHRTTLLQKQIDYYEKHFAKNQASFNQIKRIIHDTNKHLLLVDKYIQEGQFMKASEHIRLVLQKVDDPCHKLVTGNLVIDALVNPALDSVHQENILIKHDIHISISHMHIEQYDLCVILGNILDNAVEAVRQVRKTNDRFLHIRIFTNSSSLIINVANSCQSTVNLKSTWKKEREMHGLGLKNIKRVTEKYGGHLHIDVKNCRFEITAVLPFLE